MNDLPDDTIPDEAGDPDRYLPVCTGPEADESTASDPIYVPIEHPEGWLELEVPAHWVRDPAFREEGILVGDNDYDFLSISITRLPTAMDTEAMMAMDGWRDGLVAAQRACGATEMPENPVLRYPHVRGHSTIDDEGKEHQSDHYLLPVADLMITMLVSYTVENEHLVHGAFERVLGSIRIERGEALIALRLGARLTELLNELPNEKPFRFDGQAVVGERVTISLRPLLDEYRRATEPNIDAVAGRHAEIYRETLQGMIKLGIVEWEVARPNIQPMIKTDSEVRGIGRANRRSMQARGRASAEDPGDQGPPSDGPPSDGPPSDGPPVNEAGQLAQTPWLLNLRIVYGIHSGKTWRLINRYDLSLWGRDVAEVHEVAMANLAADKTFAVQLAGTGRSKPTLAFLRDRDYPGSSAILHPDLHAKLRETFGGPYYVGIPERDTCVAIAASHADISAIQRSVETDHEQSDRPISDRLFELTPDGVVVASPPLRGGGPSSTSRRPRPPRRRR